MEATRRANPERRLMSDDLTSDERFKKIMKLEVHADLGPGGFYRRANINTKKLKQIVYTSQYLADYRFVFDGVVHYGKPSRRWQADQQLRSGCGLALVMEEVQYGPPDVVPAHSGCDQCWQTVITDEMRQRTWTLATNVRRLREAVCD
jgi:hypothetical protein